MNQLEWKCCDKCGELVAGVYCFKCNNLLLTLPQRETLSDEYKEVVCQEIEKLGFFAYIPDGSSTVWVSTDEEETEDEINMEFMLFHSNEYNTIEKLSNLLEYLDSKEF